MEKRAGFTLIELLVVIAIIAILAAILFPVFSLSREKARGSTCLNNMNQLGKAFRMYLDDSNGKYPHGGGVWEPANNPGGYSDGDWIWFDGKWVAGAGDGGFHYNDTLPWGWRANPAKGSLWKYTNKSRKLYICPSDAHAVNRKWTKVGSVWGGFGLSYTMNCALNENEAAYGDTASGPYVPGVGAGLATESQLIRPTKTVLLADQGDGARDHSPNLNATNIQNIYGGKAPCYDGAFGWFYASPTPVHVGSQNWLFCDGHVKSTTLKQFRTLAFRRDGQVGSPVVRPWAFEED